MKTPQETIALMFASAIWADGNYTQPQRLMIEILAERYGYDLDEFSGQISAAMADIDRLDRQGADLDGYLKDRCRAIDYGERAAIYKALIGITLCDGDLSLGEMSNLRALARATNIATEYAMLMVCDEVRKDPGLLIKYTED